MRRIGYVISSLLLFQACNPVPEPASDNYVVEAYVFAGEPVRDITIKELVPLDEPEGESEIIEDARVVLKKGGSEYALVYNNASKKYRYAGSDLEISSLETLDLEVEVN